MSHPSVKITDLDEESVPLDATDIAVVVVDVPTAPVTRKTALGTLRRFMLGIATLGTIVLPEAVVVEGALSANGNVTLGNATSDTITPTGRFAADLDPSVPAARDIGASDLRWKDAWFSGTVTAPTFAGNASTASAWATARTITIGVGAKSVDGSTNVSWTLGEIGAAAASHTHPFSAITDRPTTLAGYGITDGVPAITLTVAGTTGRITSSAGAQDLSANRTWTLDLATSGVGAGTYGGATIIPQIAVDAYGRITSVSNVGVSVDGSNITGVVAVANGGTGIGTLTALRYLRTNAAGTAYEWRTAAEIVSEGGGASTGHTHPFSDITTLPNSLGGYGIGDAVFKATGVTDNALVRWDGTSGNYVQAGGAFLTDDQKLGVNITAPDARIHARDAGIIADTTNSSVPAEFYAKWHGADVGVRMRYYASTAEAAIESTYQAQASQPYGDIALSQVDTGGTRRSRLLVKAATGFTKISNDGSHANTYGPYHELRSTTGDQVTVLISHTGAAGTAYGAYIRLVEAHDNRTNYLLYNEVNGSLRSVLWSDGGANFTGRVGIGMTGTPLSAGGTIGSLQINGSGGGGVVLTAGGAQAAYVYTVGSTLYVQADGNIQIGPSNASSGYTTIGTSGITSYDFILSSDLRLKREAKPIVAPRQILRRVPGLRYWHIEHQRWELGFGAQHLRETAVGELTTMTDARGYHGVFYERTIPVLWESVREQDADLTTLQAEVAHLRAELAQLQRQQPRVA